MAVWRGRNESMTRPRYHGAALLIGRRLIPLFRHLLLPYLFVATYTTYLRTALTPQAVYI